MTPRSQKARLKTITDICDSITANDIEQGAIIIEKEWPFSAEGTSKDNLAEKDKVRLFIRDRFTDRYTGDRLVFPGVLKLINWVYKKEFPYDPNWTPSECHMAWYYLCPNIDHLVPLSRGGPLDDANRMTVSYLTNSAKSNFTLEELGWAIKKPIEGWDGMSGWFRDYVKHNPECLTDGYIRKWNNAIKAPHS
ncbi:MAG: HNH endonuclease [Methanomassiliicoccales archaeon]|jgi:hypothetical protein